MDSVKKTIMKSLLEKLIEDVVDQATSGYNEEASTSTLVEDFVKKIERFVTLAEAEKQSLIQLLETFIDDICDSVRREPSGTIDLSSKIDEFTDRVAKLVEMEHGELHLLIAKLSENLINQLRSEIPQPLPSPIEEAGPVGVMPAPYTLMPSDNARFTDDCKKRACLPEKCRKELGEREIPRNQVSVSDIPCGVARCVSLCLRQSSPFAIDSKTALVNEFITKIAHEIQLTEDEVFELVKQVRDYIDDIRNIARNPIDTSLHFSGKMYAFTQQIVEQLKADKDMLASLVKNMTISIIQALRDEMSEISSAFVGDAETSHPKNTSTPTKPEFSKTSLSRSSDYCIIEECKKAALKRIRGNEAAQGAPCGVVECEIKTDCLQLAEDGTDTDTSMQGGKGSSEGERYLRNLIDAIIRCIAESRDVPPFIQKKLDSEGTVEECVRKAKVKDVVKRHPVCPVQRQEICYIRRWCKMLLIIYFMLLPFAIFLGGLFALAACYPKYCSDFWPRFLRPLLVPPVHEYNLCIAF